MTRLFVSIDDGVICMNTLGGQQSLLASERSERDSISGG